MLHRIATAIVSAAVLTAALVGAAGAEPGWAGETTVVYGEGHSPSAEELRRLLYGADTVPQQLKTRGLVLLPAAEAAAPVVSGQVMQQTASPASTTDGPAFTPPTAPSASSLPSSTSVAFQIRFAFDSAEVPESAMAHLAALADAVRNAPADAGILRIVGHTDAVGSEEYNRTLSLRRAEATRRVLIERFGLPGRRLIASGSGEWELLRGVSEDDPANRRVEFATR